MEVQQVLEETQAAAAEALQQQDLMQLQLEQIKQILEAQVEQQPLHIQLGLR
jgi:hypothetical protein